MTVTELISMGGPVVLGIIWRFARLRAWIVTRVVFAVYVLAVVLGVARVITLPIVTWAGGILLVVGALNAIADLAGPPDRA